MEREEAEACFIYRKPPTSHLHQSQTEVGTFWRQTIVVLPAVKRQIANNFFLQIPLNPISISRELPASLSMFLLAISQKKTTKI